ESSSADRRRGPEPVDDRTAGRIQYPASCGEMHGAVAKRSSAPGSAHAWSVADALTGSIRLTTRDGLESGLGQSRRPVRHIGLDCLLPLWVLDAVHQQP